MRSAGAPAAATTAADPRGERTTAGHAPAGRVLSLQVGLPRTYGREGAADPDERPWTTGYVKTPVAGPVWCGRTNLAGDAQADLRFHGGPDKAVLAYGAAHYPAWRAELAGAFAAAGVADFAHGAFGENLTVAGWTEADVAVGDVHALGGAVLEVSQPRGPCWKIARRWGVGDLAHRVLHTGRTGWYYRVLHEGMVAAGDDLVVRARPTPEWTVARAHRVMYAAPHARTDVAPPEADVADAGARALAAVPALAAAWRDVLRRRA